MVIMPFFLNFFSALSVISKARHGTREWIVSFISASQPAPSVTINDALVVSTGLGVTIIVARPVEARIYRQRRSAHCRLHDYEKAGDSVRSVLIGWLHLVVLALIHGASLSSLLVLQLLSLVEWDL